MEFKEIIKNLKDVSKDLDDRGITVTPLNNAIASLETHGNDITDVEKNIKAIQNEVIQPIKGALELNKFAGKASIWGFVLGAIGLIASVGATLYFVKNDKTSEILARVETLSNLISTRKQENEGTPTDVSATPPAKPQTSGGIFLLDDKLNVLTNKIDQIETKLLFPKPVLIENNEIIVKTLPDKKDWPVLPGSDPHIYYGVIMVQKDINDKGFQAGIWFKRDNMDFNVTASGAFKFSRSDGSTKIRDLMMGQYLRVSKGDILIFNGVKISVLEIYSTQPLKRLTGDAFDGIKFRVEQ